MLNIHVGGDSHETGALFTGRLTRGEPHAAHGQGGREAVSPGTYERTLAKRRLTDR
jgi:hypothetical protein